MVSSHPIVSLLGFLHSISTLPDKLALICSLGAAYGLTNIEKSVLYIT
jgi:hypothetical protein